MQVLATGSSGKIGSVAVRLLRDAGHSVREFDRTLGHDILNAAQLREAARGCDAVVHMAACLGHSGESADEITAINVAGTEQVLRAAEEHGAKRVVLFSSAAALGVFGGQREPDYLPLDDAHPSYAALPYALSKRLGEEACRAWTRRTGGETICLRPPGVFDAADYDFIRAAREAEPSFEWSPYWEYGAFLDVRDAASVALSALLCPGSALECGHATLLLCADDISSASRTSRELARLILPGIEWRGGPEYEREPYKALLDTSRAHSVLGWRPRFRWRPLLASAST